MTEPNSPRKVRMSRSERRLQLIEIARASFAHRGYDATSIEEITLAAGISKPVLYEHFGGKEGLYQVIVDREINLLMSTLTESLPAHVSPRKALEHSIVALLDYLESNPDGYRLLAHQSPLGVSTGVFSPVIGEVTEHLTILLAEVFNRQGFESSITPVYGQLLGGAVAQVGQWWLSEKDQAERGEPVTPMSKDDVAAHTANLLWNGLHHLELKPRPIGRPDEGEEIQPS
ncbi:TetR/AcrR family transcriptional regulator [Flaviflexus massiliensis]|uniref:TetR/AcrR family transcriptional regulator n=1 Tax=Flaviflexus massiliensis TaxID=1522309 RepID=UPI0006D5ABF0|nr:TetR/AcrR family transcriptional regulator [Flaviflexus massiliensis]